MRCRLTSLVFAGKDTVHASAKRESDGRLCHVVPNPMNSTLNRRSFLQRSAAAAGLALYGAIPGVRGADAPSRRIAIGVSASGAASTTSRPCNKSPASKSRGFATSISTALPTRRKWLAGKQERTAKTTQDFRRILDDPEVEGVTIATPNFWHAPATILACDAGKHVYVEKPGSHNAQEGEWMIEAARRRQRKVQLGTQRRSAGGHRNDPATALRCDRQSARRPHLL